MYLAKSIVSAKSNLNGNVDFYSHAQLYRAIFLFGHDLSAAYFERSYGLTIQQFSHFGFVLYAVLVDAPKLQSSAEFDNVGICNAIRDAGLRRLCASIGEICAEAARLRQRPSVHVHISYQPSILRSFPCVAFGDRAERICAPLPALILWRTTAGLYYASSKGGPRFATKLAPVLKNMHWNYSEQCCHRTPCYVATNINIEAIK